MLILEENENLKNNVKKSRYRYTDNTLLVELNSGEVIEYSNVDSKTWEKFNSSESLNSFYQENIKNKFDNIKLIND
jgi:hypothetical protein